LLNSLTAPIFSAKVVSVNEKHQPPLIKKYMANLTNVRKDYLSSEETA
jgi:hypothetical protein